MKNKPLFSFFFLLTCTFVLPMLASAQEIKNALLIANGEYGNEIAALNEPIPEARNLKIALESIGFNVTIIENANREAMFDALRAFREKCEKEEGIAFFHYGGHAVQIEGANYLLPANTQLATIKDVPYNCVNVDDIMDHMQGDANIIILDSCRNNPFKSGTRGGATRGLAAVRRKLVNSITAYSAEVDGVAQDGIFTPILTQYITEKNINIEDILKKVRIDVEKKTNGEQQSVYSSRLKYPIYLAGDKDASVVRKTLKGALEISTYTPCSVYMDISDIGEVKGFSSERFDIPSGAHRIKVKYKDGNTENFDLVINPETCEKWKLTYLSKEQLEDCIKLGNRYLVGTGGTQKNLRKAFDYFKMASDSGASEGELGMGLCFEEGLNVEQNGLLQNEKEALVWFKKASEKGHGKAMQRLALFYHYGKGGLKKDYNEAKKWYEKAIASKHSDKIVKDAREGLNEIKPFIDKVNQEKKEKRKKESFEPALYSCGMSISYNLSHFTTQNEFVKFNSHGIKLGITYGKLHAGLFEARFKSAFAFCRSQNLVSETIDHFDFSIVEFQFGLTSKWAAFHITVLQPSCHFQNITHNSTHIAKNNLDTNTGDGYWGFRFGVDVEFRIKDAVSFFIEYNTPKVSVDKMNENYFLHHSINFGININFYNE